jgi:hypothetical protein
MSSDGIEENPKIIAIKMRAGSHLDILLRNDIGTPAGAG